MNIFFIKQLGVNTANKIQCTQINQIYREYNTDHIFCSIQRQVIVNKL